MAELLHDPPPQTTGRKFLSGVVASSVLLTALGALLGVYAPFYLFMLCVLLIRRFQGHAAPPEEHLTTMAVPILGAAALSFLCFRAGSALKEARRWGAYVAMGWGLFLVYFGSRIMIDLFRPYQPGAVQGEEFFEFLIAVPCIAVGAWWCVYLNLPHVRRQILAAEKSHIVLESSSG